MNSNIKSIACGAVLALTLASVGAEKVPYAFCRAIQNGEAPKEMPGVSAEQLKDAQAFYQSNLRYFRDGRPLKAGKIDCYSQPAAGEAKPVQTVIPARWLAKDGSIAVTLVNWTDETQHYWIEGYFGDLKSGEWRLLTFTKPGDYDFPPEGYALDGWQTRNMPPPLKKRRELICAVPVGELRLVPTYINCSVVWGVADEVKGLALEYRAKGGGEWRRGETPIWFQDSVNYRGSIFDLKEDTDYEMRLVADGKTLAEGAFRTWSSVVPVAKTVVLDPATVKYPIEIRESGTPEGWIRYTTKKGAVLGGKDVMTSVFRLVGVKYILLDDLEIVGGGGQGQNPIYMEKVQGVRVRNCEITGWGRVTQPVFDAHIGGKPAVWNEKKKRFDTVNWDAAIMLYPECAEVTVERCYLHDSRDRSNSWYYSHPSGTEGIFVFRAAHSIVLRWNDIVGSDLHRFNDCIEGCDNFGPTGGFNRDSDIYGNFCIFANDDCIELDGGEQNVRCFRNRFEAGISDISIQGGCTTPVYVYDNLLGPTEEEMGYSNPCIKTSAFDPWWYRSYGGLWDNWLFEVPPKPWQQKGTRYDFRASNVYSTNAIPREVVTKYPVRDLPFVLNEGRFENIRVTGNVATPAAVGFQAIATAEQPYRVRKNADADWFEVTPSEGVLRKGVNSFTVTFRPEKMANRRFWRGAFLLRTPEGLSRCVSLFGERTDFEPPLHPVPPSATTQYAEYKGGEKTFTFDVKEPGKYWYFVRVRSAKKFSRSEVSLDGRPWMPAMLRTWPTHDAWNMVSPGKKGVFCGTGYVAPQELASGRHTLTIRPAKNQTFELSGAALSNEPLAFEPR